MLSKLLMSVHVNQLLHLWFIYSNFYKAIFLDIRDDPNHLKK